MISFWQTQLAILYCQVNRIPFDIHRFNTFELPSVLHFREGIFPNDFRLEIFDKFLFQGFKLLRYFFQLLQLDFLQRNDLEETRRSDVFSKIVSKLVF